MTSCGDVCSFTINDWDLKKALSSNIHLTSISGAAYGRIYNKHIAVANLQNIKNDVTKCIGV
jgi:hypothetical protein